VRYSSSILWSWPRTASGAWSAPNPLALGLGDILRPRRAPDCGRSNGARLVPHPQPPRPRTLPVGRSPHRLRLRCSPLCDLAHGLGPRLRRRLPHRRHRSHTLLNHPKTCFLTPRNRVATPSSPLKLGAKDSWRRLRKSVQAQGPAAIKPHMAERPAIRSLAFRA
jgi:hypothetical protein